MLRHRAEVEPLYKRSPAINEKALGSDHPYIAKTLEIYVDLLRMTGRSYEALIMETRARLIRAQQHKENPAK
jgi:hypothetical protein